MVYKFFDKKSKGRGIVNEQSIFYSDKLLQITNVETDF